MNQLLNPSWLVMAVFLISSCGRSGDGQESVGDKREWSILQAHESANRSIPISGVEVTIHDEYKIVSLMADDAETRIWIMLDPSSPPYYKQMPPNHNYSLTEDELEMIRKEGSPITTTYQALKSHLRKQMQNEAE